MFRRGQYNVTSTSSRQSTSDKPLARGHVRCTFNLLDDRLMVHDFPKRVTGGVVLDFVFNKVDLQETDYFGLVFSDKTDKQQWVDPLKTVRRQTKCSKEMTFYLRVKFYVADPSNIQEELTRYMFFLQVKQDVLKNRLPVNFSTAAIISAYALQAEIGDFDPATHLTGYASEYRFVPNQTEELEEQIEMHHQTLTGLLPADCEFHYLERAQRLEMYGVDLHIAEDAEHDELMLGVTHSGLLIFQNKTKINSFNWAMMRKIGFKKSKFYLYIRGMETNQEPSVVGFILPDYRSCKILWKRCVAHHTFFRQRVPPTPPRMNGLLRFGSKYRYSGRTLTMTVDHGKNTARPEYELQRPPSKRFQRRSDGGYTSMRATAAKRREEAKTTNGVNGTMDVHVSAADTLESAPPKTPEIDPNSSDSPPKPTEIYDEGYYNDESEKVDENYPADSVLPNGLLRIKFKADDQGRFGFNIRGGDDQNESVKISKITAGSTADTTVPLLHEGDVVEQINATSVSGLAHGGIVDLIRATRLQLDPTLILIIRPKKPIPERLLYENRSNEVLEDMKRRSMARFPQESSAADHLKASIEILKESLKSEEAQTQFERLYRRNPSMPHSDGFKPENFCRNRYRDISPYNDSRVRLQKDADYINASHVEMSIGKSKLKYIAAQGPLEHTADDFWEMVWEQECHEIVMVTRLVEGARQKCFKYWPEASEERMYWHVKVTGTSESKDSTVGVIRHLDILNHETGELRKIRQFQYLDWPDHGEPDSSLEFINFVSAINAERKSGQPLLVHCSAGVGRTGMFITMETALCKMREREAVFPLELVRMIRDQRPMVIQTMQQFSFTCQAIVDAFEGNLYGGESTTADADGDHHDDAQSVASSSSSGSSGSSSGSDSGSSSSEQGEEDAGEPTHTENPAAHDDD